MKNTKIKGTVYALLSGVLYGIIPLILLNVSGSGDFPGTLCNMYRMFFGALMLLVPGAYRLFKLKLGSRVLFRLMLASVLYGTVSLFLYMSFERLPSGIAITLHYLYPLFTLLLGVVFFKQKPPRGSGITIALACTGVLLLCDITLMPERPALGIAIAAFSGLLCAIWLQLVDRLDLGKLDKIVYAFSNLLAGGMVMFFYNLARGQLSAGFTAPQWGSLLLAGLCALLAVMLLGQGIRYAGPVIASVLSTMEPIVCTLGSAIVLGDVLTPRMLLGSALVLAAVILLTVMTKKEE